MLAVIYLILSVFLGYVFCSYVFPGLRDISHVTYKGNAIRVSSWLVMLPASFLTGTLIMTWGTYLLACLFKNQDVPLMLANEIIMIAVIPIVIVGIFLMYFRHGRYFRGESELFTWVEMLVLLLLIIFWMFLFFMTFNVAHGDQLYVGFSVFSDFTPHLSMIRSFSYSQNFPTQYTVCAGSDVKYHFMFQFLTGNLEFLGLPLDWALNLPSLFSILSMYSLLYVLACKISGRKCTGGITLLFVTFRSSSSLFKFMAETPRGMSVRENLAENFEFVGSTNNEDWGLWNLNVYCNQRHFAFGLAVMLLILILFLPYLYNGIDRLRYYDKPFRAFWTDSLLYSEGWRIDDLRLAIGGGFVLGALGFFNGAVLIATVLILFFIAIVSDNRLEFLIMAAIAGLLSLLQTSTFIDGSAFSVEYRYGFLTDNSNMFSSIQFINNLLGILPILLLVVFVVSKAERRYLMFAFSTPIIMAFTVSLTPDIAVNHKYIMIAVMLLDIFAACFVVVLFTNKNILIKVLSVGLAICLTCTGIYDTRILFKRNNPSYSMVNSLNNDLTQWIRYNTDSDDIFLTANYYFLNETNGSAIILSGCRMYCAWQYFGWSAGYDTDYRDTISARIYGCRNRDRLINLVQENNIDYVVIDDDNRYSDYYVLNEKLFDSTFKVVYSNDFNLKIYKTSELI